MPLSAEAVGLGRLTVLSAIGEPFRAEVELISGRSVDRASLAARLASPDTFRRFDVPYGAAHAGVRVGVETRANGEPYIKIATTRYFREPVLRLLIELTWSEGQVTRSYAALLDLPALDAHPVPPFPARAGDTDPVPARPEPVPVKRAAIQPAPAPAVVREPEKAVKPVVAAEKPRAAAADMERELAARARALEQQAIVEDKALAEARDRIARLEQTIKEMQVLARGAPEAAAGQEAAKPTPAPTETAEDKPKAPPPEKPAAVAPAQPKPPVVAPAPAPQPESGLIDDVMDNLPLLGGAAAVVLLGALWFARRRRGQPAAAEEAVPEVDEDQAAGADRELPSARERAAGERINVIEEAEVFLAHGREAQAAKLLEEALAENPLDEDVRLKLLEVQAARKDKEAFGKSAQVLHDVTGGQGANWLKVAAMGFALDPGNALYEAGRTAVEPGAPVSENLDFGFHETLEPAGTAAAEPEAEERAAKESAGEAALDVEFAAAPAGESTTDISFDAPDAAAPAETDVPLDSGAAPGGSGEFPAIDFNIEVPKAGETAEAETKPAKPAGEDAESEAASAPEIKLDLSGISLDLDEGREPEAAPSAGEKDPHWHDVQEKFELVKAYRLLGAETESISEILQDILKEGDAGQRAEARRLLDGLSGDSKK